MENMKMCIIEALYTRTHGQTSFISLHPFGNNTGFQNAAHFVFVFVFVYKYNAHICLFIAIGFGQIFMYLWFSVLFDIGLMHTDFMC